MSDTEPKNSDAPKDQSSAEQSSESSGEAYSLEDLDQILEAEQPGFNDSLKEIQKESIEDASSIEGFGVEMGEDSEGDDEGPPSGSANNSKKEKFKNLSVFKRKLFSIREKVSNYIDKKKTSTLNRLKLLKDRSIQLLRHEIPERIKYGKSILVAQVKKIGKLWEDFNEMSRLKKLALFLVIFSFMVSGVLLTRFLGGGLLPRVYQPLMTSFSENANFVKTMGENEVFIDFFKAFPHLEFQILMPKVVVNFRRDGAHSPHSMGAFEFYLSLDSQNTAIEVRDREREFLDIIQRSLEEFTYREIMSVSGNTRAKLRIRDNITAALNQGYVGAVYINTMVTYQ